MKVNILLTTKHVNISNFEILKSIPKGYLFIHQNFVFHESVPLYDKLSSERVHWTGTKIALVGADWRLLELWLTQVNFQDWNLVPWNS